VSPVEAGDFFLAGDIDTPPTAGNRSKHVQFWNQVSGPFVLWISINRHHAVGFSLTVQITAEQKTIRYVFPDLRKKTLF